MDYQVLLAQITRAVEKEGYPPIAESTIRKYVRLNLVSKPEPIYLGRPEGKRSIYPEEALGELYAAWKMLNGPIQTSLERLQEVRILARELLESSEQKIEIESSRIKELKLLRRDLAYLMELWINYGETMRINGSRYRVEEMVLFRKGKIEFSLDPTKTTKKVKNLRHPLD